MNPHAKALDMLPGGALKDSLRGSLFHCFLHAGYDREECARLADIAIGPVAQSLDLAHAAYKLHIEAISTMQAVNPIVVDILK